MKRWSQAESKTSFVVMYTTKVFCVNASDFKKNVAGDGVKAKQHGRIKVSHTAADLWTGMSMALEIKAVSPNEK